MKGDSLGECPRPLDVIIAPLPEVPRDLVAVRSRTLRREHRHGKDDAATPCAAGDGSEQVHCAEMAISRRGRPHCLKVIREGMGMG